MPLQILQVLLTLRNFTSTIITSTAASVTAATATTVCLLTLALLFSLLLRLFFLFFLLGVLFGKHRSSDVTSNGRSPLALLWRRVGRRRTPRDCEHESLSILPQTLVPYENSCADLEAGVQSSQNSVLPSSISKPN